MYFINSIPRSGSALLISLLNQRPDSYATPTSNLYNIILAVKEVWERDKMTASGGGTYADLVCVVKGILDNRYDTDKIVFDKNDHWVHPAITSLIKSAQGEQKIIATVRPIAECVASFVKVIKPDNIKEFCVSSEEIRHLQTSYGLLRDAYLTHPDNILLIEYDNLIKNTQDEMDRISQFCGLDTHKHDLENIPPSEENDAVWGIPNLLRIHTIITRHESDAKEILGEKLWTYYQGGEFWNNNPEPVKERTAINDQHDLLISGDYEGSKKMAYENHYANPEDNDMAFNAGWAKLSDGEIQEGYKLLDRGRAETTWGDPHCGSIMPRWNGQQNVTVLLRLERGLGDQIHQVRYARDLKKYGCTVIVSCSGPVAEVMRHAEGVDMVVQHEAAVGVLHDFYLPAMTAPIQLMYKTNEDLNGESYIKRPDVDVVPGRIGLRWQGFNGYEHQTRRLFDPNLLFDAVKGKDCVSLQRDDGSELRPRWVESIPLDTWTDTMKAIASCELVITSCTSVSHLAGAMGVPTCNMIPMVPYYLWSMPGKSTPYYDSMKLFRQTKTGGWEEPFKDVRNET